MTLQKQLSCVCGQHNASASQNRTAHNSTGFTNILYPREIRQIHVEIAFSNDPQPATQTPHSAMSIGLTILPLPTRDQKRKNEQSNLVPIPDTLKPQGSQSCQSPGLGNSGAPPCAF